MNKLLTTNYWLLATLVLGTIFYFPSLNYWFAQDDFIHLSAAQISSFPQLLQFFNPYHKYPAIFFYRPLSTQLWFFINHSLFGLNPFPYHFQALTLHLLNGWLFYLIIKKVFKDQTLALISALLYTTSAAHFLSLYFISSFQQILRTSFILISIWSFLKYHSTQKLSFYFLSLISYLLSLLSKETAIVLPFLIYPISILAGFKVSLKQFLPLVLITVVYLIIRFTGFVSIFNEGSYNSSFSYFDLLNNLKWYVFWSFGLPEVFSNYGLRPINILQFIKDFPQALAVFISFCLLIVLLVIRIIFKPVLNFRVYLISLYTFIISLSPVIVLKSHRYPQYLDLAFLAFLPIIASLLIWPRKYLTIFGIAIFLSLQFLSLNLSQATHWSTHRSNIAYYYYQDFQQNHPAIPQDTNVVFVGSKEAQRELSVALAQDYALKLWYPNQVKQVMYLSTPPPDQTSTIVEEIKAY